MLKEEENEMSTNMKARKNRTKIQMVLTLLVVLSVIRQLSQHVLRNINADIIHGSTISR